MKRKTVIGLMLAAALVLCAAGALAADIFRFESASISIFEGETVSVPLLREGRPAEDGTLTWTSAAPKIASVDGDGNITALQKGQTAVRAALKNGSRNWNASVTVNVVRRVTAVTLNTTKLQVYHPEDPNVSELLREETEHDVIVLPAGRSAELRATCTPSDANNRRVVYASSDEGVLRIGDGSMRAVQAGECDLTVSSVQNPEISQTLHVMVIQPVTKITVEAPAGRFVNAGEKLALRAVTEPNNATIPLVTWSSRTPNNATVDANGVVTGLKKGTATIEAKAADGSGRAGTITLTVAQKATGVSIRETGLTLATGQTGTLHAAVQPQEATEKGVTWSSSDESIATVTAGGQVKGIRRGECTIIATSKGSPEISAAVTVQVIQRVTGISFTGSPVSLPIRTTAQLTWDVQPADASIKEVTFSSSDRNVATVDANGVVTGLKRGTATITATATDGSGRRGQTKVTVTQPVEGVSIQYRTYHIQQGGSLNVKAIISPNNANNQNVHFTVADGYVASVTDQKNIGRVRGLNEGSTILTGVTEDGGYSASAEIRVADFNRAVVVDDLYMEGENIRITLRNRGNFSVDRVYFTVETYDADGQPLVCNSDGVSTSFDGAYRLILNPEERSQHYKFDFGNYVQPTERIATVVLTITSWRDLEGYTRNIPEEQRPTQSYHRFIPSGVPENNG